MEHLFLPWLMEHSLSTNLVFSKSPSNINLSRLWSHLLMTTPPCGRRWCLLQFRTNGYQSDSSLWTYAQSLFWAMFKMSAFSPIWILLSKLGNCLTTHLDLVVHMYAQHFFKLEIFPFYFAIIDWNNNKVYYGMDA